MKITSKFQRVTKIEINEYTTMVISTVMQYGYNRYETARFYEDAEGNVEGDFINLSCTYDVTVANSDHVSAVSDAINAVELHELTARRGVEDMFGNPPLPSERGIGNYIEDENEWHEGESEATWRAECERMSAEYAQQQDEDNHPFTR